MESKASELKASSHNISPYATSAHTDSYLDNSKAFSGHQWTYFSSLAEGPLRSRAELFLASVNWHYLREYAIRKRNGINCILLPDIGLGYNHMVRIIEFADDARWVARLRMPPLAKSGSHDEALKTRMKCEINVISLVRQKIDIPVPQIHAFEVEDDSSIKAPFMLMDCLEGNIGMDLGMELPPEHKKAFLSNLAKIHVQLSAVQLPKIGTIVSIDADGTYQQGPIPGLGGPFDTATEFFEAWAAKVQFGISNEKLRAASGPYAAEIIPSVASFTEWIDKLASRLSVRDHGPFPLCHGDFGHNNVIVDDNYHILGVIDWETAFAGPWEVFGDFPLTFSTVPSLMDAPRNYDERGYPKSPDLIQKFVDQKDYIAAGRKNQWRQPSPIKGARGFEKKALGNCDEAVSEWESWMVLKTDR
ncbi:aminoglycoside phosphotransferase protein [Rutstroemia sp. NJR-2017a BBW]|nr:aminoglycoside phosphotransferase protein [Rutstroemia sp. NJR-2017a BBW]